jgi:hypothetical protein
MIFSVRLMITYGVGQANVRLESIGKVNGFVGVFLVPKASESGSSATARFGVKGDTGISQRTPCPKAKHNESGII